MKASSPDFFLIRIFAFILGLLNQKTMCDQPKCNQCCPSKPSSCPQTPPCCPQKPVCCPQKPVCCPQKSPCCPKKPPCCPQKPACCPPKPCCPPCCTQAQCCTCHGKESEPPKVQTEDVGSQTQKEPGSPQNRAKPGTEGQKKPNK